MPDNPPKPVFTPVMSERGLASVVTLAIALVFFGAIFVAYRSPFQTDSVAMTREMSAEERQEALVSYLRPSVVDDHPTEIDNHTVNGPWTTTIVLERPKKK